MGADIFQFGLNLSNQTLKLLRAVLIVIGTIAFLSSLKGFSPVRIVIGLFVGGLIIAGGVSLPKFANSVGDTIDTNAAAGQLAPRRPAAGPGAGQRSGVAASAAGRGSAAAITRLPAAVPARDVPDPRATRA